MDGTLSYFTVGGKRWRQRCGRRVWQRGARAGWRREPLGPTCAEVCPTAADGRAFLSARVPFLHLLAPTLDDVDIPMTSIALPRELVHAVCDVVDTSSLAATLLVSHHWRASAQPRLLRSIVVRNADSDHNLTSFLAFLDLELCAVVAPHIQKPTLLGRRG